MSQPIENSARHAVSASAPMQIQSVDDGVTADNSIDHASLARAQGVFIARQGIFIQTGEVGPYIEAQDSFAIEQSNHLLRLNQIEYSKLLADFIANQANLLHNLGAI